LRPTPSSLSGFFGTFDLSLGVETFSARGRRHRHIDVFPTATSSLSPRNQPIDTTQAPKHVTSSHAPRPRQRPGDEETKVCALPFCHRSSPRLSLLRHSWSSSSQPPRPESRDRRAPRRRRVLLCLA
jgi:hypothetical protein